MHASDCRFGAKVSEDELRELGITSEFYQESFRDMISEYRSISALSNEDDFDDDRAMDGPALPAAANTDTEPSKVIHRTPAAASTAEEVKTFTQTFMTLHHLLPLASLRVSLCLIAGYDCPGKV